METFVNHPPLDFAKEDERRLFAEALRDEAARFPVECPLVIGGRPSGPENGPTGGAEGWMRSSNPSHPSHTVGWAARASAEDAGRAMAAAVAAFPEWSRSPVGLRCDALRGAADFMERRRHNLAALVVHEAGKPWREADADVCEAIDFLRYYALEMESLDPPTVMMPLPGERNEYAYFPLGPGAVIAPWNFPVAILTGMTAAAIVAGNTVVMKPAEQTPVCAWRVFEALVEGGGLPPGVLNFLPGEGGVAGEALVGNAATAFVAFTGSVAVGLRINEAAARIRPEKDHVTRVIAEMGGKNAIIVDASADIDAAVTGVVRSAFHYAGQKCSACSRVLVLETAYDAFVDRLRAAALGLKVGPAEDPATQVGPLIDMEAVERVVGHGGHAVAHPDGGPSQFVAPTIREVDDPLLPIMQEEVFGPVVAVMRVPDFDAAIRAANSTRFALTAGLFTRTPSHIARARRELEAGNLYINRSITGAIVGRQPFGGFKLSGIGSKAGGPDYLKQFLVPRVFTENTMRHGFAPVVPE